MARCARVWQGDIVPATPAGELAVPRLHRAARIEDAVHGLLERRLRRTGWKINIIAYAGYGGPGWARVLCRVLLGRPEVRQRARPEKVRGWRSFATLPAKYATVTVEAGGVRQGRATTTPCSALARSALTSRLRARAAPAGAARPGRPWHRPRWTAGCGAAAPARPRAVTCLACAASRSPVRAGAGAPPWRRRSPARSQARPMTARTASGVSCR